MWLDARAAHAREDAEGGGQAVVYSVDHVPDALDAAAVPLLIHHINAAAADLARCCRLQVAALGDVFA